MAKQSEERLKSTAVTVGQDAPSYLAKFAADDHSTDSIQEYRVLNRVKVIQAMTSPDLKRDFGEGTAVLIPVRQLVVPTGGSFLFVPLMFWPEFIKWRDINDKGGSAIIARSTDKAGEIAVKSRDAEKRLEVYPDNPKFKYRYVEHLNFAGLIYGENTPVAVSFSRGEFFTGRNFCTMIGMRKIGQNKAPLWMQVWQMKTAMRNRNGYSWWGLEPTNPAEGISPWIQEDEIPLMQALYKELYDQYGKNNLGVDLSDADDEAAAVDAEM